MNYTLQNYSDFVKKSINQVVPYLGSDVGPEIQANGRLTFEDDLRSGGLLYFPTLWTNVRTEYGYTGWTWAQGWLGVKRWQLCLQDISRSTKCYQRVAVDHWISMRVVGWLIVHQLGILSLSCSQYSQTICWPTHFFWKVVTLHCVLYYMYLEKTRSQSEVVHTAIFCCLASLALQRECNFLCLSFAGTATTIGCCWV